MRLTYLKTNREEHIISKEKLNIKIFTVKDITLYIRNTLKSDKNLHNIWIKGEITNFKKHTSGHMHFDLKDEESIIACVMFKVNNQSLNFTPEHGMKILVRGSIDVYTVRGRYQMLVEEMRPEGLGDLHLRFLQLKEKLQKEGLFLEGRKRPIPEFPEKIGIVTSLSGAVLKDMLRISELPASELPATKVAGVLVFV